MSAEWVVLPPDTLQNPNCFDGCQQLSLTKDGLEILACPFAFKYVFRVNAVQLVLGVCFNRDRVVF